MRISVVQMNSQNCVERNLEAAASLITRAHRQAPADLYVLPEYTHLYGAAPGQIEAVAETIPDGPICTFFATLARQLRAAIHCGTINEPSASKVFNSSVVFGRAGETLCRYRKMHLIEGTLANGRTVRETKHFDRGSELGIFALNGTTFACTTCFDFRFPELFRALRRKGADAYLFVTALAREQGEAHQEILLRARAIENQSYLFASCQCGSSADNTRHNYGNSMIIDPWGKVVERLGGEPGVISHNIDGAKLLEIRATINLLKVADSIGLDQTAYFGRAIDIPVEETVKEVAGIRPQSLEHDPEKACPAPDAGWVLSEEIMLQK
jgi:deaminated glutathione amidase